MRARLWIDDGDRRRLDGRAGGRAGAHRVRHRPGPARRCSRATGCRWASPASPTCSPASSARSSSRGTSGCRRGSARRCCSTCARGCSCTRRSSRLEFHESYTSGRIISRQTSDLDAIRELLDEGINQLVRGVLYMVVHGGRARPARLDVGARAARARSCRSPCSRGGSRCARSGCSGARAWRQREAHRAVRRDHDRHPRRAGVPQGEAQREGVRRPRRGLPRRRTRSVIQLFGIYDPGLRAHRQRVRRGRARSSAASASSTAAWRSACCSRPCSTRSGSSTRWRTWRCSTTRTSRRHPRSRRSRACSRRSRACPTRCTRSTSGRRTGNVRFEGVEFAYTPDRVILPRFDLDIPAGQTIALVGSTGAGKSTLAKLIARFYDPSDGVVELDGVDLRDAAPEGPAPRDRHGHAGGVPVLGLGRRQHRARHARRVVRRDRRRREGGGRARVHRGRCRTGTTPT